jgi:DNA polymerase elongation subunit (family B)
MILDIEQNKYSDTVKISYIDSDRNRQILSVKKRDFWKWRYYEGPNADIKHKSWDDKRVVRISYKDNDTIDKKSIWEWINTQPEYKNILYEFNMPKILFCDIETDIHEGFPDVTLAKEKITAITVCWKDDNNKIQVVILGEKENFDYDKQKKMNEFLSDYFVKVTDLKIVMKYVHIPDEVKLLESFVKICSKFPVITGWNFINTFRANWANDNGFDWPFLTKRMDNLKVDYKSISPTNKLNNKKDVGKVPHHFAVVDYMYYFDAFDRSIKVKESKSLDFVSSKVLKVKKLKYGNYPVMNGDVLKEMYAKDYDTYCLYNAVDTILVLLIHEKRRPFSAILAQGNGSCNPIDKADSAVNVTEGYMSKAYTSKSKVMPIIDISQRQKEWYEGAFVKSPIAGLHTLTACYDFSSLYPSISRFLELGFENFDRKETNDLKYYSKYKPLSIEIERPKNDEVISVSGCIFKKGKSTLKGVYDELYANRKKNQYRSKLCAKIAHEIKQNRK